MKTKTTTKLLSALLTVVMLLSVVPLGSLAGLDLFGTKASALDKNVGDIIEFGSYPQSKVMDTATLNELNKRLLYWHSYGYYSDYGNYDSMLQGDYMKYADTVLNGIKYRAVEFTQYRPYWTGYTSSADTTYQDDNGYYTNTIYWFKYEPLKWRILDPARGLILCETCIDSQPYNNTIYSYNGEYWNDKTYTHYASDYKTSSIREWLNNDFYNIAFTDSEKEEIARTNLDNSSAYNSKYNSESTNDKIFLLSYNEMLNSSYGFSTSYSTYDVARRAKSTDYAKSQGCWQSTSSSYQGNAHWFLRSPGYGSISACHVDGGGNVDGSYSVNFTLLGIRPALRIHPTSDNPTAEQFDVNVTSTPDCKSGAIGGGKFYKGEFAQFNAYAAENETFLGWFVDDSLVSTETTYRFMVTESVDLEARFEKNEQILSVKLNNRNIDTEYNRNFTLKANVEVVGNPKYEVKYSSSNTSVATVDSNGNVKTVGKGNATITVIVTDSNGNVFTDTCNVKVKFTFWQWLLYIICFGWIWM